jgi:hypothetical protein
MILCRLSKRRKAETMAKLLLLQKKGFPKKLLAKSLPHVPHKSIKSNQITQGSREKKRKCRQVLGKMQRNSDLAWPLPTFPSFLPSFIHSFIHSFKVPMALSFSQPLFHLSFVN